VEDEPTVVSSLPADARKGRAMREQRFTGPRPVCVALPDDPRGIYRCDFEGAEWRASVFVRVMPDGRLGIGSVTFEAREGVTSALWRSVKPGEWLARIRAQLLDRAEFVAIRAEHGGPPPQDETALLAAVAGEPPPRRRGPAGPSLADYRRLATAYLELQAEGYGQAPGLGIILELARRESEHRGRVIPESTVRRWVAETRKLGFLTSEGRGRAGGQPGPKLPWPPGKED
jgi:hypothetical protein